MTAETKAIKASKTLAEVVKQPQNNQQENLQIFYSDPGYFAVDYAKPYQQHPTSLVLACLTKLGPFPAKSDIHVHPEIGLPRISAHNLTALLTKKPPTLTFENYEELVFLYQNARIIAQQPEDQEVIQDALLYLITTIKACYFPKHDPSKKLTKEEFTSAIDLSSFEKPVALSPAVTGAMVARTQQGATTVAAGKDNAGAAASSASPDATKDPSAQPPV